MSNKQLIYKLLRNAGITEAGALGILGNWQAESGCEPGRLQNDFSAYRTASKDYTARVTSGAISRQEFARDKKGFGLAQWTYFNFQTGQGRKLALYDFWKKSGKALDDVTMQVAFALHELTAEPQYAGLWQILRTTDDIWTATDKVCRLYEQPYYCNVDARFKYAKEIAASMQKKSLQRSSFQEQFPMMENQTNRKQTTMESRSRRHGRQEPLTSIAPDGRKSGYCRRSSNAEATTSWLTASGGRCSRRRSSSSSESTGLILIAWWAR